MGSWLKKEMLFVSFFAFGIFATIVHGDTNLDVQIPVTRPGPSYLEGTLRLPSTSSTSMAVPGVVLIHGSGPQNRDAVMAGQLNMIFPSSVLVFRDIGEALQQKGIAVLTYDKRTCGTFNLCSSNNSYPIPFDNITVDSFLEDAYDAVKFLQSRSEIQSDQVVVVGHSQSGSFVPILLQRQPDLYGGVILAGPYRQVDDVFQHQYDSTIELLETSGVSEQDALATIPGVAGLLDIANQLHDLYDAFQNGDENGGGMDVNSTNSTNATTTASDEVAGASIEFWNSWFDVVDRSKEAALDLSPDQHVLILSGEFDWNVPVQDALDWYSYMTDNGSSPSNNVEIVTLPCITHAMNCVNVTDGTASPNVSSVVIETLASFILSSVDDDAGGGDESGVVDSDNPVASAPASSPTTTNIQDSSTGEDSSTPASAPSSGQSDGASDSSAFDSTIRFDWTSTTLMLLSGFCSVFL